MNDIYVNEAHTSGVPEDYIELYNTGLTDCSLEGFKLDNSSELDDFIFGDFIIISGGYWLGYKNEGSSFTSELSNNGDEIWLADPQGISKMVTLSSSVELDGSSLSQSFTNDGIGCYTNPTPGEQNAGCITLALENQSFTPNNISLINNFPNPFNPSTNIIFQLNNDEKIIISIYDIKAKLVKTIHNGQMNKGRHTIPWSGIDDNGNKVGSGIYLCSIESNNSFLTRKMVMVK